MTAVGARAVGVTAVRNNLGIPVIHDSMSGNGWDWFSGGKRVGVLY